MAKIAFFEIEKWEEELVKNALSGHELVFTEEKLDKENYSKYADFEIISPFIYSSLTNELLTNIPNLKFIATRSVGYDHIDINYCKEKNIVISNIPKYGGNTVAEHTFALILAISRKLIPSIEQTKRGDFTIDNLTGFDLCGKTIGVVGAGHIGKKIIDMALCFGMKVLIFTRTKDESLTANSNVTYAQSLDDLFANSDVITFHLPHTKETEHIVNMGNIDKFKKGCIIINTARGNLIETQAILEGIERGIFKAVGLDVLEEEATLKEERELLTAEFLKSCDLKTQLLNHVLLTREEVIITPHNAFNSKEALTEIIDTTVANINGFIAGRPQNIISAP